MTRPSSNVRPYKRVLVRIEFETPLEMPVPEFNKIIADWLSNPSGLPRGIAIERFRVCGAQEVRVSERKPQGLR